MNLCIVLCQTLVFAVLLIQKQLIIEVAAEKDNSAVVDRFWFNSLEKKLKFAENTLEDVVVDSSDSAITSEKVINNLYLQAESSTKPHSVKNKKGGNVKKKAHPTKPKRLNQDLKNKKRSPKPKTKKETKKKDHVNKKQRIRRKFVKAEYHRNNISEKNISVEGLNRGKPVDIIVHIKMNE